MARRAGVPSGEARWVIVRALEIVSVLEFRKSGIFSQCASIFLNLFWLYGKTVEWRHIYDSWRSRKNLSGINLSLFDGVTGDETYDAVANYEPNGCFSRHSSKCAFSETFVKMRVSRDIHRFRLVQQRLKQILPVRVLCQILCVRFCLSDSDLSVRFCVSDSNLRFLIAFNKFGCPGFGRDR